MCPWSSAWTWWRKTSFVVIAWNPAILCHNVFLTSSARNVLSHTICFCIHHSSTTVWLKRPIKMPRNHYQLKQMTLVQATSLTCPTQIWWTVEPTYDDFSNHGGDGKWSDNKSMSVARLQVIHIFHYGAFSMVTAITSSVLVCSSCWHLEALSTSCLHLLWWYSLSQVRS